MSTHGGGGRDRQTMSDTAVVRAFASAPMQRITSQEGKAVFDVVLGGRAWVAKDVTASERANERAASEIERLMGLGDYQPRLVTAERDGKTYVLTERVGDRTLHQIETRESFDAMRDALHTQPVDVLTRMVLTDYAMGDTDRSRFQYVYNAGQGRVYAIDHAAAFEPTAEFVPRRYGVIAGINEHPGAGGRSWREVPIAHADIRHILDARTEIQGIMARNGVQQVDGGYFFIRRMQTLARLAELPNPTLGDLQRLSPGD